MKKFLVRSTAAAFAAVVLALSGCGGGGGGDLSPPDGGGGGGGTPPPPVPISQVLTTASADAANDTSVNATAPFTVLQAGGVAAVTVNSPPKVNFAVFSDGQLKKDLTLSNVSFTIAKLVPASNGNPDQWVNYIYRKETPVATVGPNGAAKVPGGAMQATTDPKQSDPALAAQQLVLNADGYYTYTFSTDIKNPAQTNNVAFEASRTHRVVIQLSYTNAAGQAVVVNPYFDFTLDSSGKSVLATASQTRKMVDVGSCNNCHTKLALHGGGRVDTQYCVMCHNPGTKDANSGNVLTLATMVHKIHSGKILAEGGEDYTIWGYHDTPHDYAEVGFPQPVRNCVACHDGSNPKTPQGDNWKSVPSKEACLSCHLDGASSGFYATHVNQLKLGSNAAAIPNSACASCHSAGSPLSPEKVHWVQEMANASKYQAKVESVTITAAATATATGTMTVKYSVVDPASGNPYDLRQGCRGTWTQAPDRSWSNVPTTTDNAGNTITGCNANYRWDASLDPANVGRPTDKFGMFSVYAGFENVAGVTLDDTTATASYAAYKGVDDGKHHYTANLTIPMGASGTARVLLIGGVSERRLDPVTRNPVGAVPALTNEDLAYVPVKNALAEVNVATGGSAARRAVVSNDNCNKCHGILGLPTGAAKVGFHKGHRNNSETCAVCHNANQAGGYTLMTDGSTIATTVGDAQVATNFDPVSQTSFLHESYQAKRFVHGIHYGAKRNYPFTHCMNVGGEYNKDGTNKASGGASLGTATCVNQYPGVTDNFTAEVAYPASLTACASCHVNDSWKQDRSKIGSVVFKPVGTVANRAIPGSVDQPLDWYVLSPKAGSCTSCHDAKSVQTHVKNIGGGAFADVTQRDLLIGGKVFEACEGCHAPGSAIGVDTVHGAR